MIRDKSRGNSYPGDSKPVDHSSSQAGAMMPRVRKAKPPIVGRIGARTTRCGSVRTGSRSGNVFAGCGSAPFLLPGGLSGHYRWMVPEAVIGRPAATTRDVVADV